MADKIKRISVNAFDKVLHESPANQVAIDWRGNELVITPTLSLEDMLQFVTSVVKSCYNQETGSYTPENKHFAIYGCVLALYANFTLPKNLSHRYDLIYRTDAVGTVLCHINLDQYNEICAAIDATLDHMSQIQIESANKQVAALYSSLENIESTMSELFKNVTPESFNGIMGALAGGKIDEGKIMQAYLDSKRESANGVSQDAAPPIEMTTKE